MGQKYFFKYLKIFYMLFLFSPLQTYGQVNTEKMRNVEAQKGFQNTIGLGAGFLAGNSDQYRLAGNYRLDWLTTNYYSFLVVNYERGESSGKLFSDKGFIHARSARNLTDVWIAEAFTQKEFNKLISLKDRQLFGGGLRYELRQIDTEADRSRKWVFGLGSGMMYEREVTTSPQKRKTLLRSTNYLSVTWQMDDRVSFFSTTYFQIALRRTSDLRVLNESSFSFSITKTLSFLTSFNLRYDNEPPHHIKKYDMAVNNGINVGF